MVWYLVFTILGLSSYAGSTMVTIPFPSEGACKVAGEKIAHGIDALGWKEEPMTYTCVLGLAQGRLP